MSTPPTPINKSAVKTTVGAANAANAVKPQEPKKALFTISRGIHAETWMNMLVYADHGIGKTRLCGSACEVPEMCDVLVISAEAGQLTLQDWIAEERIDFITCTTFKQVGNIYDFLKLHCKYRDDKSEEATQKLRELEARLLSTEDHPVTADDIVEPRRYRTIIIDSLTEIEAYCMYQLMAINIEGRMDEEIAAAEWADFRKNNGMVQKMVRQFRNLPMHCLFTAARNWTQDENKKFNYSPALTGQLSRQVRGFVDLVGYMVTGTAEETGQSGADAKRIPRRMYVQPIGKFGAKCRFPAFKGSYFDDPDMKMIMTQCGLLRKPAASAAK